MGERLEPLAGLDQQQKSALGMLHAAIDETSERGKTNCAAVAACEDGLDELRMTTATFDAHHATMLDASLERLRELRAAGEAATAFHSEALSALRADQVPATEGLAQQHGRSGEIARPNEPSRPRTERRRSPCGS